LSVQSAEYLHYDADEGRGVGAHIRASAEGTTVAGNRTRALKTSAYDESVLLPQRSRPQPL